MANFTQEATIPLPAEEVPTWMKANQVAIYTDIVVATVLTYDASELPMQVVSK